MYSHSENFVRLGVKLLRDPDLNHRHDNGVDKRVVTGPDCCT